MVLFLILLFVLILGILWFTFYFPLSDQNDKKSINNEISFVCISMEHRKKSHYDLLDKKMKKENIQIKWKKGINGKKIDIYNNPFGYTLSSEYIKFFEKNKKDKISGKTKKDYRGHLGCTISHLQIISQIQNMTVILEDDVEPVSDFDKKLNQVLSNLNQIDPNWEILLLGWCCGYQYHHHCKSNDQEPIYQGGIVKVHYWFGGWGYVIRNEKVAKKIMSFFNPIKWHIDLSLAEEARLGNLNVYGCVPTLINHAGSLRISSFDFWQKGDNKLIRSDTNNEIPDSVPE